MLKYRVIPCLLLKDDGLVKTEKFKNPVYIGDPINAVRIFNEKEVDELIILDISATIKKAKPNFDLIQDIASECFMPFCYGGGITELNEIKKILNIGAEKVSINTYAIEHPLFIKEAAKKFGSQSIIVSIDTKKNSWGKYEIYTRSDSKKTALNLVDFSLEIEKMGAGEIIVNSIERDGRMGGYDIQMVKEISERLTIPVIALGGAGKIDDLAEVIIKGKASAAAAGSLFVYHGKQKGILINYPSKKDLEKIFVNE